MLIYFLHNNHFILSFGFRVVFNVAKTTIIRPLNKGGMPYLKTQKTIIIATKTRTFGGFFGVLIFQ